MTLSDPLDLWNKWTMVHYPWKQKLDLSQCMTKPTKWSVHPAKTQISLGILGIHADSEDAQADHCLHEESLGP